MAHLRTSGSPSFIELIKASPRVAGTVRSLVGVKTRPAMRATTWRVGRSGSSSVAARSAATAFAVASSIGPIAGAASVPNA